MAKTRDPIKKITLGDGRVRYRFVVDVGRDENGKRRQLTKTYDTKREARAEYDRIRHQNNEGTYVRPSKKTVSQYLDEWLEGVTRDLEPGTKSNYRHALRPVHDRLGARYLQSITKADVEALVTWMTTAGRRRGGKPGTGLSGRSARLTLGRLTAALDMAVAEGMLVRNVAKLVKPPTHVQAERGTWSRDEVRRYLAEASTDRLHGAWRGTLYGLRRGEVLGLRWAEDVDLDAGTLTVNQARVIVDLEVIITTPKSRYGFRTLPLDPAMVAALRALKARQAAEKLAAGEAYVDSGYVVVDELGAPVHPEWYSDEFGRVAKRAGVPRITLHDGRHTCMTLMEHAGVPISVISRWAGHHDPSFTYSRYVHAGQDDLRTGTDALAQLHKID